MIGSIIFVCFFKIWVLLCFQFLFTPGVYLSVCSYRWEQEQIRLSHPSLGQVANNLSDVNSTKQRIHLTQSLDSPKRLMKIKNLTKTKRKTATLLKSSSPPTTTTKKRSYCFPTSRNKLSRAQEIRRTPIPSWILKNTLNKGPSSGSYRRLGRMGCGKSTRTKIRRPKMRIGQILNHSGLQFPHYKI